MRFSRSLRLLLRFAFGLLISAAFVGCSGKPGGVDPATVARKSYVLSPAVVTLTPAAADAVTETIKRHNLDSQVFLRIGVVHPRKDVFQYKMDFSHEPDANDVVFESTGRRIVVAKQNVPILQGTVIDFESGSTPGFRYQNPNAE